MLDTLVEALALREVEQAECQTFLGNWVERYLSFTSLSLLDANGNIVCSNIETEMSYFTAGEDFFTRAMSERGFVIGEYAVGRTGKPMIVAARPIFGAGDQISGAVAVGIDLRWLEYLALRMDLPPGSTVTAMGGNGDVLNHYLAGTENENGLASAGQTLPSEEVRRAMASLGEGVQRGQTEGGSRRVFGYRKTDAGGLVIAVGMPEFLEFERYGAALRDTLAAPIAVLLLALLAAAYASEALVTRWARMLTKAAERMAKGELSIRSNVPHTHNEIGRLAAAFDSMADVIQREQQSLQGMIDQRQALLSELNHRVKNNLQMIMSLISIKSRSLADSSAKGVLLDVESRIRALSEIHNLLHGSNPNALVPADFIENFTKKISEFYGSEQCTIEFVTDRVDLRPDQAIAVGLIINELVTNACKHAFPDEPGNVIVELRLSGERIELTVADNGVHLPAEFESRLTGGSIGLKMIQSMARQINGTIELRKQGKWKTFRLEFPR